MNKQEYKPDIADQQRIVIALGIVATDIALLAISNAYELAYSLVVWLFFLPAVFSFLFIVLTGSHLKFKRPGDIGEVAIPHILRRWSYDAAINTYWWALMLAVLTFIVFLFGWNGQSGTFLAYWPTFFILVGILAVIVLVMFGLSRRESKSKKVPSKE